MLRRFAIPVFWLIVLAAIALVVWQRGLPRLPIAAIDPASEAAFEQWLAQDASRAAQFRKLNGFLKERDAANVVPAWQLTRIDAFYAGKCDLSHFVMPPEDLWPNIVAPLQLVRDEVVPVVGPVSVQSSYRTPELNACARGAARSRHLDFAALDLRLRDGTDDIEALYRDLCAMHRSAGPASRMGLGAYYDDEDDGFNRGGRFHIDAAGWRTWGRSYGSASSPCGSFS